MPTVIKGQPTSKEVLQILKDENRPIALSFSGGKDSLAAWLAMREYDIEVVPVYFWMVPNLKFVNDMLDDYEDFFGVEIHRYPTPAFYRMLKGAVFQSPERLKVLDAIGGIPTPDYPALWKEVFDELGLDDDTWKADGVRAADSIVRRSDFTQHGVMKHASRKVSPVADFLKAEVINIIKRHGVKLPIDYEIFGRTFDGVDNRFTKPLKEHIPEDFETLKTWFPLIEADHIRWGDDPDGI